MRKAVSFLILVSMTVHCFSRLGLVSYVYSHRYEISYSLGITAEKVISLCRSDYFEKKQLGLSIADSSQVAPHASASGILQAQEINLFEPSDSILLPEQNPVLLKSKPGFFQDLRLTSISISIFRPPCILA